MDRVDAELSESPSAPAGSTDTGPSEYLVSWFWCVTITSVRRTGVRQTDDAQVLEDRKGAGVAAPLPNQSPNSCLGQQNPHLARTGQ